MYNESTLHSFVAGSAGQLSFESPDTLPVDTILPFSDVVTNIANLASSEINSTAGDCNSGRGE